MAGDQELGSYQVSKPHYWGHQTLWVLALAPPDSRAEARGWAGQRDLVPELLVQGAPVPAARREPDPGRVLVSALQFMQWHPAGTTSVSGLAGAHSCPPPLTVGSPSVPLSWGVSWMSSPDEFPG